MINTKDKKKLVVSPGKRVRLGEISTRWEKDDELLQFGSLDAKEEMEKVLAKNRGLLASAQELLWASDRYAVLIILQGMDAAGKDGTIRHVMSGVNPQGCRVSSFRVPTPEEADHDFLWRYSRALPGRGEIGVFNRSYYEEVLVVRVHPELLSERHLAGGKTGKKFWKGRFGDINAFEEHLARTGTVILKFFLHISRDEQKERLLARLRDSEKYWKFSLSDIAERQYWDAYQDAYEEALAATSTAAAPWYIIPADQKWVARALVAEITADRIRGLDLRFPPMSSENAVRLEEARKQLEAE